MRGDFVPAAPPYTLTPCDSPPRKALRQVACRSRGSLALLARSVRAGYEALNATDAMVVSHIRRSVAPVPVTSVKT
jgi:hypothetical protein